MMRTLPWFIALVMAGQSSAPTGFDRQRLDAIPKRMQQFIDAQEISGTVVLVRHKGKVVLAAENGLANREKRSPMKRDTVFQVMSMTKPVTALAIMICAERGLLNLDDPVERFFPALEDLMVTQPDGTLVKKRGRMTIRNLLTHTSGLPSVDPGGIDDLAKVKLTLAEYAALFPQSKLIAEPNTRISYSGPGIALAGRIVELVSGKSLPEFMRTEIFAPLEMNDTTFFATPALAPRLARMYFSEDGALHATSEDPMRPGARYANPAGGLYSTAPDMANLLECILRGGSWKGKRILSPRSCAAMTTLQTGELTSDGSDAQGYGLGFSVVRSIRGSSHLKPVGSFGHTGAFGTEFWADPTSQTVVVFMSQSFADRVRKTFNTMVNAAYLGP